MIIAIGCDNIGFSLKEDIKEHVASLGHEVVDCGCNSSVPIDYPDVALAVTDCILTGKAARGILLCGTGIGMAMAANKVKGIRAAQCSDEYSAERAAKSNDAHIITMGVKTVGPENARRIVQCWIESSFTGGPSAQKIDKIMKIEEKYGCCCTE